MQQVDYRSTLEGPDSGERGNVIISEVLWSGTVREVDGERVWDPSEIFIEIRNQGSRPVDMREWKLELTGAVEKSWTFPTTEAYVDGVASDELPPRKIEVGEHAYITNKRDGCFLQPDWIIEDLVFLTATLLN